MAENSDLIEQFVNCTGTDVTVAANMLEAFNNNLELAVNMFLEGDSSKPEDIQSYECSGGSSSESTVTKSRARRNERQLAPSCTFTNSPKNGISVEGDEVEEIRAPIPQRQVVLTEDRYHAIPIMRPRKAARSVFDSCRDFQKETEEYEDILRNGKRDARSRKRKRLHDLFQPPYDLIHDGDFQSARDACNSKMKWLLVNIQKCTEFSCQVFNRDVWSNKLVREIVDENFILWQVSDDSDEGLHYATFYKIKNFPHISVIDPRTGERMVVWEDFGVKPDPETFVESATQFLAEHSSLNDDSFEINHENKAINISKKSVIDLNEEDQLEEAVKASLVTVNDTLSDEEGDTNEEEEDGYQSDNIVTKVTAIPESPVDDEDKNIKKSTDEDENATCEEKDPNDKKIPDTVPDFSSYDGEKTTIMLRLPDSGRKQFIFPLDFTLKDLSSEISRLGWNDEGYEIVKAFPRQNLSQLDQSLTLKDAGMHKQETLFVQDR